VLIAGGVVLLTLTLGLVPSPSGGVVGVTLAVAGLTILASYLALNTHWWTLIAGPTLLALGAVILLPGGWDGAIFLGGIGVGFVLVALTGAQRWWAVIPAGTLLTLASIVLLGNVIGGSLSGALLFFGLAATFGVVAVIPIRRHFKRWLLYPAIGCLLFGLLIATSGAAGAIVWPLALVAVGVFLLIRAQRVRAA
jgi:hypothetical protein